MAMVPRSARKRRATKSNTNYSQLEQRRLLAGDVSVFQHEGLLFVRGDTADNQMEISVNDDGDVEFAGTQGTTINQRDEAFILEAEAGEISGGLRVNMGRGDDSIFIEGVQIENRAVIFGSWGNDSVGVYQTQVEQDLLVQTFFGDDMVSVDETEVGGQLLLLTLHGDDVIGVGDSHISGRTIVLTGHGDDSLAIKDSIHEQSAHILGLRGNDFVATDNVTVNGFANLLMGPGADDVYLNNSAFGDRVFANGMVNQSGQDNLEVAGETTFEIDPRVIRFEGSMVENGMQRANDVFQSLIADGARLGTITEIAALTPELSTLVSALQDTGLDTALEGPGPLTAFAPLNTAFDAISDVVSGLTTEELADVLKFHVAPGAIFAEQLVTVDSVDTLLGQSFSVDILSDEVILNGNATLAATDIRARNGVIHLLNDVLIP